MALEDFIRENEWHENDKLNKEKLFKEELCPVCGEPGEKSDQWYWRCTTDFSDCNVITYHGPQEVRSNA